MLTNCISHQMNSHHKEQDSCSTHTHIHTHTPQACTGTCLIHTSTHTLHRDLHTLHMHTSTTRSVMYIYSNTPSYDVHITHAPTHTHAHTRAHTHTHTHTHTDLSIHSPTHQIESCSTFHACMMFPDHQKDLDNCQK